MVSSLLEGLERNLALTRPDYLAILLPGVSDDALDVFEAWFSLRLPMTSAGFTAGGTASRPIAPPASIATACSAPSKTSPTRKQSSMA